MSYTEMPAKASLLYAIVVPPDAGDTLFANMYAAYDALPPDRKERLQGLIAVPALDRATAPKYTGAQLAATAEVRHPLIRTHPETGRKAIYAGVFARRIEGLSETESEEVLAFLGRHCTQAAFQCRYRWRAGDLVMWDNRCVLHRALEFDPALERHMHRTTLIGDTPV
jgi:taurine dioxygenase